MKSTLNLRGEILDERSCWLQELGVTSITLYRWAKNPDFPQPRKIGNNLYFNRRAMEEFLLNHNT